MALVDGGQLMNLSPLLYHHGDLQQAQLFLRDNKIHEAIQLLGNNHVAKTITDAVVTSVLGSGFSVDSIADIKRLNKMVSTGFDKDWFSDFSEEVKFHITEWGDPAHSDSTWGKHSSFYNMVRDMLFNSLNIGDAFGIIRRRNDGRYKTCVEVVRPNNVRGNYDLKDNLTIKGGKVFASQTNAPIGFNVVGEDGREFRILFRNRDITGLNVGLELTDNTLGSYQIRGLPIYATVLEPLAQLQSYITATGDAAVLNSKLVAAITTGVVDRGELAGNLSSEQYTTDEEMLDLAKRQNLKIGGATIAHLAPTQTLQKVDTERPDGANFKSYISSCLRSISAAVGISYEQLSNDYSSANFSSTKASRLDRAQTLKRRRNALTNSVIQPTINALMHELLNTNKLPLPAGVDVMDLWNNHRTSISKMSVTYPTEGWVDPVKEAQAAELRLRMGITSKQDEAAGYGYNYREVTERRANERIFEKEIAEQSGVLDLIEEDTRSTGSVDDNNNLDSDNKED